LPAPEGEEILFDYAATGLTLRRHPVALLRPRRVWRLGWRLWAGWRLWQRVQVRLPAGLLRR